MDGVLGIDVSHHQQDIDWDKVAADGIKFAYIRTGDGVTQDRKFERNWHLARSANLIVGAYHFFRFSRDPLEQATLMCRSIKDAMRLPSYKPVPTGVLPCVIDVEQESGGEDITRDERVKRISAFLAMAYARTDLFPFIYTCAGWWEPMIGKAQQFTRNPLWVAHVDTDKPMLPSVWRDWLCWQYSWRGGVRGVPTMCDLNRWNGDESDLRWYARLEK